MSSNIRKQFQRVQQRLDQSIGRAEKSQVLSDEQQELEKRVEHLRTVSLNLSKKLQNCLTSPGQPTDSEKLLKKLPWYGLSQSLVESSDQLGRHTSIGQLFLLCGDAEANVAKHSVDMEGAIENNVLKPILELLEVDYPSIQKLKKQLSNRALDMDGAKARHAAAVKQLQQGTGLQAKVDTARDEVEDASSKMEQTRDHLATEMYSFITKESDLSRYLLALVKAEVEYHQRSVQTLGALIPQLEEGIEFSIAKPVFGLPLEEHLEYSNRKIASVLEDCITSLIEYSLEEEGLFRLAGSALKVKKLKAALNSCSSDLILCPEEFDSHAIATVLKQYLRELPEPLMTFELYNDWTQTFQLPVDQRVAALHPIVGKLPQPNKNNLRYLLKFLAKLAEFSDVNKMTPSNIALVMSPNLLWPPGESGMTVMTTGIQSAIVELLIANVDYYFPDKEEPEGCGVPQNHTVVDNLRSSVVQPQYENVEIQRRNDLPVGSVGHLLPDDQRAASSSVSPGVMRKRTIKKPPAPRPPAEGCESPADAAVQSPPSVTLAPPCTTNDPTPVAAVPDSPGLVSPRIARPKERPPERPPMPPGRSSVGLTTPDVPNAERSRSPSLTGAAGDERGAPRLYPVLAELGTDSSVELGIHEKKHSRNPSDTGVPGKAAARPMPPPPPTPAARDSSIKVENQYVAL